MLLQRVVIDDEDYDDDDDAVKRTTGSDPSCLTVDPMKSLIDGTVVV